jgi:thiamine kinase-like enzyme
MDTARIRSKLSELFHDAPDSFTGLARLGDGISNTSYLFAYGGERYVVRVTGDCGDPVRDGAVLDKLLAERDIYRALAASGAAYADELVYFDPFAGIKVTRYIANTRYPDMADPDDVARCARLLRRVHDSGIETDAVFDLMEVFLEDEARVRGAVDPGVHLRDYEGTRALALERYLESVDEFPRRFNHIDPIKYNFLFTSADDRLIDFEYSRMASPMVDLAAFSVYHKLSAAMIETVLRAYLGREPSDGERHSLYGYLPLESIFSALWYLERLDEGGDMRANMEACYACALLYAEEARRDGDPLHAEEA